MKPVSGENAPEASISRSATSRALSVTAASFAACAARPARSEAGAFRSTSSPPPCAEIASSRTPADVVQLLEPPEQLAQALLDGFRAAVDDEFGLQRFFVRVRHAGERFDLAGERLLVKALHVALDEFVDRAADIDFEEAFVSAAHLVADL